MTIFKIIGGPEFRTDKATIGADIELNDSTATTLAAADEKRLFFSISNPGNKDVWLQFDVEPTGFANAIFVPRDSYWEMPLNIYTGEIKGIADSGSPTVTVCEY